MEQTAQIEDAPSGRSERREEIKIFLEYIKLAISLSAIIAVAFAAVQWRDANRIAQENVYQRMTSEWRTHQETFITRSELRPFFYEGKTLLADDVNRNAVLAIANVRLDAIDAVLTFGVSRVGYDSILGWRRTFAASFKNSPVLCMLIKKTWDEYGFARQAAAEGCPEAWGLSKDQNSN